jgi:hypothetical protein
MENTVTLPLDRYHYLVDCEKITNSRDNGDMIFLQQAYGGSWNILNPTEGVKECNAIIKSQVEDIARLEKEDSSQVKLLKKKLEIYNDNGSLCSNFSAFDKIDYMELFTTLKNRIVIHNKLPWYKRIFKKI